MRPSERRLAQTSATREGLSALTLHAPFARHGFAAGQPRDLDREPFQIPRFNQIRDTERQQLASRVAGHLAGGGIDVGEPEPFVADEDPFGRLLEEGPEVCLLQAECVDRRPAVGHVARDAEERRDAPLSVIERRRVRFNSPGCAFETGDAKFENP